MSDTQSPPPTDGELAARVLDAVRYSLLGTGAGISDQVETTVANAVLVAVFPELNRLRDGLTDKATKIRLQRDQMAEALRILDAGPQPVNDHVVQHWSIPAMRAADVLRPGVRAVEA